MLRVGVVDVVVAAAGASAGCGTGDGEADVASVAVWSGNRSRSMRSVRCDLQCRSEPPMSLMASWSREALRLEPTLDGAGAAAAGVAVGTSTAVIAAATESDAAGCTIGPDVGA